MSEALKRELLDLLGRSPVNPNTHPLVYRLMQQLLHEAQPT